MRLLTPLELEFKVHYGEYDRRNGPWDSVRVRRLCRELQITEAELAQFIRLRPCQLTQFGQRGQYPNSIKLLLDLIERSHRHKLLGTVYKTPLFPHLPNG